VIGATVALASVARLRILGRESAPWSRSFITAIAARIPNAWAVGSEQTCIFCRPLRSNVVRVRL
jgi:hypothetical protein